MRLISFPEGMGVGQRFLGDAVPRIMRDENLRRARAEMDGQYFAVTMDASGTVRIVDESGRIPAMELKPPPGWTPPSQG